MGTLTRGSSLLLCAAAMVGLAHAQTPVDNPPPSQAPGATPGQTQPASASLEDIIVTAQHRATDVQDTAAAITVLSSESLSDRGIDNLNDAMRSVSAVQVRDDPLGSVVVVRGVQPVFFTDPSVNVNVDGVYQLAPGSMPTFDLERIEVLKGPQGTDYGRNALGGVVNFVNHTPGDVFGGHLSMRYGNYEARRVEAAVDLPLSDQLTTRTAVLMSERDGYLSNGNMDEDISAFRETLRWTPTEDLEILLTGEYDHFGGQGMGSVPAPLSSHSSDPWYDNTNPAAQDSTNRFVNLRVNWDLGGARLSFQTAWQEFHVRSDQNLQNLGFGMSESYDRSQSYEVRLSAPADAPVQWAIGAYHFDSWLDSIGVPEPLIASEPHFFGATATGPLQRTASDAVFGNISYPLTDTFRVTAGVRYTVDQKRLDTRVYDPTTGDQVNFVSESEDFPAFTYRFGVEYDVAPNSMLYATVSRGFKSGGLNAPGQSPATYEPEFINAYEVGSKNEFFDRTLRVNFDAFYYDNPDKQVQLVGPCNPASVFSSCPFPETVNSNASAATIYGAELQTVWNPSLYDTFYLNAAYTHARFDELIFNVATLAGFPPVVTITPIDRSGDPLPNVPLWSGTVGYEHAFVFSNGAELRPGANVQFSSGYDSDINYNYVDQHQSAYHFVNAQLTFISPNGKWTVAGFINNIDDVEVRQRAYPGDRLFLANPRTFGVTLNVNF